MFLRLVEQALAHAMSHALKEAPLEDLLGRLRRVSALSEEDVARLIVEVRRRVDDVERESRDVRDAFDRALRHLAERILHCGPAHGSHAAAAPPPTDVAAPAPAPSGPRAEDAS